MSRSARLSISAANRSLTAASSVTAACLHHAHQRIGLYTDRERPRRADWLTVEPHIQPADVDLDRVHASLLDPLVRQMRAGGETGPGLEAVAGRHRHVERVEESIVRMTPWGDVPSPDELRIHRDEDAT